MSPKKVHLLAGVSALALLVSDPKLSHAADIPGRPPLYTKAPPVIRDSWSWWLEGGAQRLGGDPGVAGMGNPAFDAYPKNWGWQGAVGFDYRSGMSGWIWSGQFRYGSNGTRTSSHNPLAQFATTNSTFNPIVAGLNSADRKEHNWSADFMVGRDLGLGSGTQALKFGVRIAEIRGKTTGTAQWNGVPAIQGISCVASSTYCINESRNYVQNNKFFGAGPRLEFSGMSPIGGGWAFEYMVGAAGLYGQRKADQSVLVSQVIGGAVFPSTPSCVSGCPVNATSNNDGFVFNADAMAGISYAFNPNAKVILNYRFDGYWNALRGWDSSGKPTNLDRYYHGPMLRLVVQSGP